MRVCVAGLWHLGTVTAGCVAEHFDTLAYDPDPEVVESIRRGRLPVDEPGLRELIQAGVDSGRLRLSSRPEDVPDCDVLWIAFDTPVDEEDRADVAAVEREVGRLLPFLREGATVLISSQFPVGTTGRIARDFAARHPGRALEFAYSPENLRLGKALEVFRNPDRIVVGTATGQPSPALEELLGRYGPIEWMRVESAEMTKHAINAFLALSVTFANEIAALCERVGADAKEVERGLKTEQRIGPGAYLGPGGPFAGGTLARDQAFLSSLSSELGLPSPLIGAIRTSNEAHKGWAVRQLSDALGSLEGKRVALLGLTYKPGTNTLRRSSAVELARDLLDRGCEVRAFDPAIPAPVPELPEGVELSASAADAVRDADAVVVSTGWPEFRSLEAELVDRMRGRVVVDPNRVLPEEFRRRPGVRYFAVGTRIGVTDGA